MNYVKQTREIMRNKIKSKKLWMMDDTYFYISVIRINISSKRGYLPVTKISLQHLQFISKINI